MALLDKKETEELVQRMMEAYPDARCALDHGDRFQLLVAVVLSAQTTDVSVNKVTPALFAKAPDAFAMAAMPEEEISEIIRTIGMYRTKAHNVKALSAALVEKYDGEVPGDYDRLVELPGVGRKTANVVLAEAFGQQRIAVDTHVFRLANRIGLVCEKDVVKTEEGLMKVLPEDHWTAMHHALIWHGRRVCTARKPDCENCCIEGVCRRNGL
ncbi:MAG: endonuclease III [Firmicutes bacterium]|nr:endonuclease III [Bacillota bacterium]MBQ1887170.1 endonuclease III [Bacillota bacterium]MBQ3578912.1 endonuclease III [Bacillota bacterium]MBQ4180975.1 endonuclease III [Bacillota bacterium]MBQ4233638.1 endonuclease III [Bacillota bacterium]